MPFNKLISFNLGNRYHPAVLGIPVRREAVLLLELLAHLKERMRDRRPVFLAHPLGDERLEFHLVLERSDVSQAVWASPSPVSRQMYTTKSAASASSILQQTHT